MKSTNIPENMNISNCPLCDISNCRHLYDVNKGKLLLCSECNVVFYAPRPTLQELEDYYNSPQYRKDYQTSCMTGPEFAETRYKQFVFFLNKYGSSLSSKKTQLRLLDVGCGTGDFLHFSAQHGWQVEGVEISDMAACQASKLLGKDCIHVGTINTAALPANTYDVVTSYHVIEHLLDPISMLQHIYEVLRPGGVIFLETPNINSLGAKIRREKWSQIIPPEHINYFNPSSVRYALERVGFSGIHAYTIRPQKIEILQKFPSILRSGASAIYGLAPLLNLGASLQAIAIKPVEINYIVD
ncbi:MAG: methyltransferase domain-containing protein [Thainema sp.]